MWIVPEVYVPNTDYAEVFKGAFDYSLHPHLMASIWGVLKVDGKGTEVEQASGLSLLMDVTTSDQVILPGEFRSVGFLAVTDP